MDAEAIELLAHLTRRMECISEEQHALHRERERLRLAATRLRLGEPAGIVRARLQAEQVLVG